MSFGIVELTIVAAISVLIFGSKAIPSLARSLGSVRHEFDAGRTTHPEQ